MEIIFKMTPMDWPIFWLSILAYVPLIFGTIKDRTDKSQVFTTWALYFLLDLITMFSSVVKDGSFAILFGFSVGSLIMATILFTQRRFAWTWLETVIIILVVLCIVSWKLKGPGHAIVAGILSECFVGIYLIIKTWKNPRIKYNLIGYTIFFIVSILSMVHAKDWSIPQMGYPFCETILCFFTILPLIRKKWKEEKFI
jgi:hypothetical protein